MKAGIMQTHIILCLLCFLVNVQCIKFYHWDLKPYLYEDKADGALKGMVIDYFIEMKKINENCPFHTKGGPHKYIDEVFQFVKISDNRYMDFGRYFRNFTKNPDETTVWFPFLGADRLEKQPNVTTVEMISNNGLVVVTRLTSLDTLAKISKVFKNSWIGEFIGFLALVGFALVIRFLDFNSNPDYSKWFIKSFGTSIWYGANTMISIGYGDVTARRTLARTVAVISMFVGLVFTSTHYAVANEVFQSSGITSSTEKLAVLKDSFEETAIKTSFRSTIIGYESYEEVLDAVRNNKADKAIVPRDIAAYMQDTWNQNSDRANALAVSHIMEPFQVPIIAVFHGPFSFDKRCSVQHVEKARNYAHAKHKRMIKPHRQSQEDFTAFLLRREELHYVYVVVAALVVLGFCYDIGRWVSERNQDLPISVVVGGGMDSVTLSHTNGTIEVDKEEFISLKIELRLIDTMLQELLEDREDVNGSEDEDHIYCTPIEKNTKMNHQQHANHAGTVASRRDLKRVKSVPRYVDINPRTQPASRTRAGSFPTVVNRQQQNRGSSKGYDSRMLDNQPIYERPIHVKRREERTREQKEIAAIQRANRNVAAVKRGKTFVHSSSNGHSTAKRRIATVRRGESFPARITTSRDTPYERIVEGRSLPRSTHYEQVKYRPRLEKIHFNNPSVQHGHIATEKPSDNITFMDNLNGHLVITEC